MLNHILDTLLSIPALLLAIIVVAFARPSVTRDVCRLATALLPCRMVRSECTAWCMMNWKYVILPPTSGWRDNAEYSVVRAFCEYLRRRSGRKELPGRCRWRFWTSPRCGRTFYSARGFPLLNGAPCWGMRRLSMSRRGRYATRRGDNAQCFTGKPARRWDSSCDYCGGIMPLLDIRNLTIEFKTSEGWVKAVVAVV